MILGYGPFLMCFAIVIMKQILLINAWLRSILIVSPKWSRRNRTFTIKKNCTLLAKTLNETLKMWLRFIRKWRPVRGWDGSSQTGRGMLCAFENTKRRGNGSELFLKSLVLTGRHLRTAPLRKNLPCFANNTNQNISSWNWSFRISHWIYIIIAP